MNEFDVGFLQIAFRHICEAENKLSEVYKLGDLRSGERREILSIFERIRTQKMRILNLITENNKTADVWR